MDNQTFLVVAVGALLALSWLAIVIDRVYLAPLALATAWATYIISYFVGLIFCLLSFGQVDPGTVAKGVIREVLVRTVAFVVILLATVWYILYLVKTF